MVHPINAGITVIMVFVCIQILSVSFIEVFLESDVRMFGIVECVLQ